MLSHPVRVGQIGHTPHQETVIADSAARAALAAAFGLPAVASLRGDFSLRREAGGVIAAELALRARVTQICVVTLEPFEADLNERSALRFIPAAQLSEVADSAELDDDTLNAPDELPYIGDTIDLGAALAEQLALALDPYPRKPGAELPNVNPGDAPRPFAALATRRLSNSDN